MKVKKMKSYDLNDDEIKLAIEALNHYKSALSKELLSKKEDEQYEIKDKISDIECLISEFKHCGLQYT